MLGSVAGGLGAPSDFTVQAPGAELDDVGWPVGGGPTFKPVSLAEVFPGASTPNPVGAVEVSTNAPLGAYLSVVDGSSQDPILVLAP